VCVRACDPGACVSNVSVGCVSEVFGEKPQRIRCRPRTRCRRRGHGHQMVEAALAKLGGDRRLDVCALVPKRHSLIAGAVRGEGARNSPAFWGRGEVARHVGTRCSGVAAAQLVVGGAGCEPRLNLWVLLGWVPRAGGGGEFSAVRGRAWPCRVRGTGTLDTHGNVAVKGKAMTGCGATAAAARRVHASKHKGVGGPRAFYEGIIGGSGSTRVWGKRMVVPTSGSREKKGEAVASRCRDEAVPCRQHRGVEVVVRGAVSEAALLLHLRGSSSFSALPSR
jgi:hypothetical protein